MCKGLVGIKGLRDDFVLVVCGMPMHEQACAAALRMRPFDLALSTKQNILTDLGFSLALKLCMRLKWGACCFLAPMCSSWIWLSRRACKFSCDAPLRTCCTSLSRLHVLRDRLRRTQGNNKTMYRQTAGVSNCQRRGRCQPVRQPSGASRVTQ